MRIDTQRDVLSCRVDWLGESSFLLVVAAEGEAAVMEDLQSKGGRQCSDQAFQAVRIENGWPLYGVDISESNLPQEVARDERAISFTKGCYIGQETVARIDAMGHVNQYLTGVRSLGEAKLSPGDELQHDGKRVAKIVSATWSPRLSALAGAGVCAAGSEPAGDGTAFRRVRGRSHPPAAAMNGGPFRLRLFNHNGKYGTRLARMGRLGDDERDVLLFVQPSADVNQHIPILGNLAHEAT